MAFIPGRHRMFFRLFLSTLAIFAVASLTAAQGDTARSTMSGVYTDEQAERGKIVFEEGCTECHTARMWGTDWNQKTVADIYEFISQYMPEPAPGSLTAQQTRDLVAFFLKSNRVPSGSAELPGALEEMKKIRMERPQ